MATTHTIDARYTGGPVYTLTMEPCGSDPRQPSRTMIQYALAMDGRTVFEGSDFGASPMDDPAGVDSAYGLLSFLSLQAGDVDDEYFDGYSAEQIEWRDTHAGDLSNAIRWWGERHGVAECRPDAPGPDYRARVAWEHVDEDGERGEWVAREHGRPIAVYRDGEWLLAPEGVGRCAIERDKGSWFCVEATDGAAFLDFGVSLYEWDGEGWFQIASHPCLLSSESYGFNEPEDEGCERVAWTADEWREALQPEVADMIDQLLDHGEG